VDVGGRDITARDRAPLAEVSRFDLNLPRHFARRVSTSRKITTMPPRLNVSALSRSIAFRPKPQIQWPARSALRVAPSQCRPYSDAKAPPAQDRSKKVDSEPIEHVSEEAAKTAQIMGEQGPDINQGTPVEDVRMSCDRD
jgi:hypothetical protein